jgi:hypothetical protein
MRIARAQCVPSVLASLTGRITMGSQNSRSRLHANGSIADIEKTMHLSMYTDTEKRRSTTACDSAKMRYVNMPDGLPV